MDYASAIEPISMLKSRSAKLVQIAQVTKKPVVITQSGRPAAVLMDFAAFEEQRNRLLLLQYLAQGDAEIRRGKSLPQSEVGKILSRE
jgi:prevent-host-death family protein